jgi:hypothetical protein
MSTTMGQELNSQVAAAAAPSLQAISREVSFQIVLLLNVVALHQKRQPVEA